MNYRRFGRTELSMPVISCGGMRYQFKWQDVEPKEIPRENQQNLEATILRAADAYQRVTDWHLRRPDLAAWERLPVGSAVR